MSALSFKNALGVHPHAMSVRSFRAEVLANNLANADTPDFKSRDVDFQSLLTNSTKTSLSMTRTHPKHFAGKVTEDLGVLYRNPTQPAIDGNTVDTQIEQAAYTENAIQYNASFEFTNARFKGLNSALRGE